MRKEKKKSARLGTMDAILIFLAIFLLVFIGVMLWLYYITGAIPDTLCTCVFGACTGEAGFMGAIMIFKLKYKEKQLEAIEDAQGVSGKPKEGNDTDNIPGDESAENVGG